MPLNYDRTPPGLCRDTLPATEDRDARVCLFYAGHDTDPAGPDEHRDGSWAWERNVNGVQSWLCSESVS